MALRNTKCQCITAKRAPEIVAVVCKATSKPCD
jgi:hypothetical protein